MTTEVLSVSFPRRGVRRGGGVPGLFPILVAFTVWGVWAVLAQPFAALGSAARQGFAASDETLFLAVVSLLGLAGVVLFAVAVGAYLLALRSLRRTR